MSKSIIIFFATAVMIPGLLLAFQILETARNIFSGINF